MKFARFVTFTLVIAFLAVSAMAQTSSPRALPADVDLREYGILAEHHMTVDEMAKLNLRPIMVTERLVVLNYSHALKAFFYDTLMPGEIVAVTNYGEPVYKVSCSNRIATIKKPIQPICPQCPSLKCPPPPTVTPCPPPPAKPKAPGAPSDNTMKAGIGDVGKDNSYSMPDWLRSLWHFLSSLLLFLLALALLSLLLGLLAFLILAIFDVIRRKRQEKRGEGATEVPTDEPPPTAGTDLPPTSRPTGPPPAPTVPGLGTGTRGSAGEVWFGPFQSVIVSDRQRDGFHVSVDGRSVATFREDVRLENAGRRGSWVVVTEWR